MEVEKAIGILGNVPLDDKLNPEYIKQVQEAFSVVKTALERPVGEWVKDGLYYVCSVCGEKAPYCYPNEHERFIMYKSHFCPNCGADMRGDKYDKS